MRRILPRLLATAVLAASLQVPAQSNWQRYPVLGALQGAGLAFDEQRNVAVMFGGKDEGAGLDDTWVWDGQRWFLAPTAVRPGWRSSPGMAYDSRRGRVVMFGGWGNGGTLADTWEWDGSSWLQRTPATVPPARGGHGMTFDRRRGVVVMFGGWVVNNAGNDTWEWDGTNWTQRSVAPPPGRAAFAMQFDGARGVVLAFGGSAGSLPFADTWSWDGALWTRLTPINSPSARAGAVLVEDRTRGRLVLFGGSMGGDETWEWDGMDWSRVVASVTPTHRSEAAATFDVQRNEIVMFGGAQTYGPAGDTWIRDAMGWRLAVPPPLPPRQRRTHVLCHDSARNRLLLVNGYYAQPGENQRFEMWQWNGAAWGNVHLAVEPSVRSSMVAAFDAGRGRLVLGGATYFSDTWEWDGTVWQERFPSSALPILVEPRAVYDAERDRVVVVGARASGAVLEAWEWDGANWSQRPLQAPPSARRRFGLAYDASRSALVLFGGATPAGQVLGETWEARGAGWQLVTAFPSPSEREGDTLAYDPVRMRCVLFGGRDRFGNVTGDTWDWDGGVWVRVQAPLSPTWRRDHAIAYDGTSGAVAVFGGEGFPSAFGLGDFWRFAADRPPEHAPFGRSCNGSGGPPILSVVPGTQAWLGDQWRVRVDGVVPLQPVMMIVGFSRTSWFGQFPLPFDLLPLGAPGCLAYVRGDLAFPLANIGGWAPWSMSICNCPEAVGARFYNQVFALDPGANALGATTTNGIEVRIGAR